LPVRERANVLAEGDEMNLVVAAHGRAIRAEDERGIVALHRVLGLGKAHALAADNNWSLR
jgi:hypothetical protein